MPFGIQSTQMHINYWNKKNFEDFENLIDKINKQIINLDYIIDISNPNSFQSVTNYLVEKL